jgi:hypothetical protein
MGLHRRNRIYWCVALAGTAYALLGVPPASAQLNLLPELAAKSKAVPVKPKARLAAKKTSKNSAKKTPAIKPKALAAAKVAKKPVAKTADKIAPKTAPKTEAKPKIEAKIVAQPAPLPRPRPWVPALTGGPPPSQANRGLPCALLARVRPPPARPPAGPFAVAPTNVTPPADVAAL